jgi:hypothetical protein
MTKGVGDGKHPHGRRNSGHIGGYHADRGVVGQSGQRSPILWWVLSALLLLTMGGIHLYLVLTGFGGLLGVLFVLNAIGGSRTSRPPSGMGAVR